jgi:predicted RNA-binding Zn-ribbon protein involved in translation (DUF1610 family)
LYDPAKVFVLRERKLNVRLRDALIQVGVPYVCAECGQGPTWKEKPLTLHVDHINGVNCDDRFENLRFLCPNCHTQTDTFCSRNVKRKQKP